METVLLDFGRALNHRKCIAATKRTDEAAILSFRYAIAVACEFDQLVTITNDDPAPPGVDHTRTFEDMKADGNATAFGGDHQAEEFVGDGDFITSDPVMAHDQPAGEAGLDAMVGIGDSAMGGLHQHRLHEPQQASAEGMTGIDRFEIWIGIDTQRRPCTYLNKRLVGTAVATKQQAYCRCTFPSEYSYLGRATGADRGNDRGNGLVKEIDVFDWLVGMHKDIIAGYVDAAEMRYQQVKIGV